MKKVFAVILPLVLAILAFVIFEFFANRDNGKGALQVTSSPVSNVYLNGKFIGTTPICKCNLPDMFPVGDYTIKMIPQDTSLTPYEDRISIVKSVLTVVD